MLTPHDIASAMESAGFTHLVWIPDTHLGTWEPALRTSRLAPIRVCREGEAIGIAIGLMLGGAKPIVAFNAPGSSKPVMPFVTRRIDLKLPLKLIIGIRSERATQAGKSTDNCPRYAERVAVAWGAAAHAFRPCRSRRAQLGMALKSLADQPTPAAILWAE